LSPAGELGGVNCGLEVFAADGHVFAEVEAVAEVGDGGVAFADG
jgi:hypothetical protein